MRSQRSAYPETCKRRSYCICLAGRVGWSVFFLQPSFLCLAMLEQSSDRVGIRYTRHWSQLMEPSQFLRLLQFRCSRFYYKYCIPLCKHQSFNVSIGLDEASCPSRWSDPYSFIILHPPSTNGLGLVVSPKLSLPLTYRGVQAVTSQRGALIGDSRVVAFALPPRVTAVPFVPLPPRRHC